MKKTSTMIRTGLVALLLSATASVFGQSTLPPIDPLGPQNPTMANTTKDRGTVFDPEVNSFADELINSILFFNPDQVNSFTLRASKTEDHVDGREMEFTSYVWYQGTDGTDYTEITGETGMTLSRSGLTPGYHYYQVRGVINPDGLDESLLCEGPLETFVVYVLPPLSVAVDGTSTNTDNAFIFCESEGNASENVTLSSTVSFDGYSVTPEVTDFEKRYRWYAIRENAGSYPDVSDMTKDPTLLTGANAISLGEGVSLDEINPKINAYGKYKVFVEVEYTIKDRSFGMTEDRENRNRPHVIYRGWFGGNDMASATEITVTPAPGKPHITIEGVND